MAIGNIAAASASGVLPKMLFTSLVQSSIYPVLTNTYHDGSSQRRLITDGTNPAVSLSTWRASARLSTTDTATLRTFYESHVGTPFYFYDPFEVASGQAIGSNYDATEHNVQGRHTVRFSNSQWNEATDLARTNVSFELIEVA